MMMAMTAWSAMAGRLIFGGAGREMGEIMNAETGVIFQKFKRKVKNANKRAAKHDNNQTLRVEDVIHKWETTIFCHLCGRYILLDDASIDHLIPLSRGGGNAIDNITIVHKWCNHEKGDKESYETSEKFKKLYDPGDTGSVLIDSFGIHLLHSYRANPFRRSDLPKEFDNLPYIGQIRIVYNDIDDQIKAEHEIMKKHKVGYYKE